MKSLYRITNIFLLFLFVLSIVVSCTEKLDIDQRFGVRIEPELEGSILYVEVPERIINLAPQANFFTRDFNFDGFSSDFFAERVLEGTVTYVIENTTSKALEVTVEFLDESGAVLDTEFFAIDPPPSVIPQRETAYGGSGRSIDIIKSTSSIRVSVENLGGTATTSNFPNAMVTLKSKGRFKLKLR